MKKHVKIALGWVLLILLDQLTKIWALGALKDKNPIEILPGIFELRYIENRGAAFGILQNQLWFFVLISIIVLGGILYLYGRTPEEPRYLWIRLCMHFIGAGAIGNMIDRVIRRYVVDFFYFKLIDFPVFNVADIYVTCSAIFLVILVMFYYKDEELDRILPGHHRK